MKAQVLSTGDELILGHIYDTNASFLAGELSSLGIQVEKIQTAGDTHGILVQMLKQAAAEADLVLVTGGLGPTRDDITAMAAADAFDAPLCLDDQALVSMKAYFVKRGFAFTRVNEKQAWLPSGATMLKNENGTAPGFCIRFKSCLFFFLPGVPREMKQMFEHQVKPKIFEHFDVNDQLTVEKVSVFGLGESRVGQLLDGFEAQFDSMRLSFRAVFPVIEVKMIYHGDKILPGQPHPVDAARQWVISRLEGKVYSDTGLSLPQELGRLLGRSGLTLAVAESCTGGLISHWVTNVAGSSDYFLLSATTYANEAKMNVLNVKEDTLVQYGAVAEQTALEMARGVREAAGSGVALSTTGIAGPGGGTREKPVGTVCVAAVGPGFETVRTYHRDSGDRHRNKELFAAAAMNLLIRELKRCYPEPADSIPKQA